MIYNNGMKYFSNFEQGDFVDTLSPAQLLYRVLQMTPFLLWGKYNIGSYDQND